MVSAPAFRAQAGSHPEMGVNEHEKRVETKIDIISSMPKRKRKVIEKQAPVQKPEPILALPAPTLKTRLSMLPRWRLAAFVLLPIVVLIVASYLYILKDLPSPSDLREKPPAQSTKILDRNGKLIYSIYVSENRTIVPISEIPKSVQQATIAIEDKDFYHHGGINFVGGIFRAIKDTILTGHLEGGSTITQQLIKQSLLTPEQTLTRKIKEAILAFWTERLYSKDEILELYLNRVPYGGTAYGIEEGARIFFGKRAKDLNLAEASLLAGLPQAPTYYSPFGTNPDLAIRRQKQVLNRMVEDGYITSKERDKALKTPLKFSSGSVSLKAPHFVAYVKEQLVKKYGEAAVDQKGLKVTTTLDLDLQNYAQATVAAEVQKQRNLKVGNSAALITNPSTGEILTMVGSYDYDATDGGKVNVTLAERSPGSSIKPLVFALGFLKGISTPATAWIDSKFCFPAFAGKAYCPGNYDGRFHGVVQSRFALGNSYNIPAVKQLAVDKVEDFIATASAMGVTTFTDDPERYGYSLALGGGEVKMVDMATAFGVFANGGRKQDLVSILKVEDSKGTVLEDNTKKIKKPTPYSLASTWDGSELWKPKDNWVLPEAVTFLISHILLDDGARSGTFGSGSILNIPGKTVSVKTGTTEDKRDNWTIGYTTGKDPRLTVVWVGNNNNTPMSPFLESGNTGAAPIWNKLMRAALDGIPSAFPKIPSGVSFVEICALSGLLPDHDCPKRGEYFIKAFIPNAKDNIWDQKQKIQVYKDSKKQPGPGETPQPDQLEEQDHVLISDPLQKNFCVDCAQ